MVSVERMSEFSNSEMEAELQRPKDSELETTWPAQGNIMVESVSTRYRSSLPLAIQNVSFQIQGGARVGVVGRTGSGKSTLTQLFFRLLEAEKGRICIDGMDIAEIGLHRLRTSISIIPQSPTLFAGCTIRENLDWFGKHSEDSILDALREAHLESWLDSLPEGMNTVVSDGGANFSVGERQLLCLARALLNRSKILILDEATANVDRQTDQKLQDTLAATFRGNTIIAIAHRLQTIIDFDWVLVLDQGQLVEQGVPRALQEDTASAFSSMAIHAGYYPSKAS